MTSGYLIVVQGSIADAQGLNFIIDTGTTRTCIDRRLAQKLALPLESQIVLRFGKPVRLNSAHLPSLGLGPLRVENLTINVADLSPLGQKIHSSSQKVDDWQTFRNCRVFQLFLLTRPFLRPRDRLEFHFHKWFIPTMVLTETATAASFGVINSINSIGHIGGFIGPYAAGQLNDRTGSLSAGFLLIAVCYLLAGTIQ